MYKMDKHASNEHAATSHDSNLCFAYEALKPYAEQRPVSEVMQALSRYLVDDEPYADLEASVAACRALALYAGSSVIAREATDDILAAALFVVCGFGAGWPMSGELYRLAALTISGAKVHSGVQR